MLVDEKKFLLLIDGQYKMIFSHYVFQEMNNVRNYLDFSDAYFEEDSYLASVNVAHNLGSLYFRAFNEKFSEEIKGYAS